jgi:hypothetical protein
MKVSPSFALIEGHFGDPEKVRETRRKALEVQRQNVLAAIEAGLVTPEQVPHWV